MKTLIVLLLLTVPASAKMWVPNDPSPTGIIAIFSDGDGFRLETNEHVYRCEIEGTELVCDRARGQVPVEFRPDGSIRLDGEIFTVHAE